VNINKEALRELIDQRYDGHHRRLARDIGIGYLQTWRLLNDKVKPGGKFLRLFMAYCDQNDLDFQKFFTK